MTGRAFSTIEGYERLLARHVYPTLGERVIDTIKYSDLTGIIPKGISAKTYNNLLVVVRGVTDLAVLDGHLTADPALRLRNVRVQKPSPTPSSWMRSS